MLKAGERQGAPSPHKQHDRFRLRFTQRQETVRSRTISQESTRALTRAHSAWGIVARDDLVEWESL